MLKKVITIILICCVTTVFAGKHDAELLSMDTEISVSGGKATTGFLFRILVNNRNGERFTHVRIPVSNLSKVSKIKGQIRDSGGHTIKKLKSSDITRRSAFSGSSFYTDDEIVEFTLKHNQYPYIIEYSYQLEQKEFLYLAYWMPVLDNEVCTKNATLKVEIPDDYAINYRDRFIDEFISDTLSSPKTFYWKASYTNIIKEEELAPPVEDFLPAVVIVPGSFKFENKGSLKSWTDYGNWQFSLLDDTDDLPETEKINITSLTSGVDDDYEKVKILYHYLQDETRYIDIAIETGGMKPYPASYVAANKYGDCKALTNYFRSVLNYAGINACYTKVFAGNPIDEIETGFPSQQFNHVILFVPLKHDSLWLDCTSKGPFGYAGTFIQGREALVVEENNSRFLHTPELSAEEVLETRKFTVEYQPQNTHVGVENTYRGRKFELYSMLKKEYTSDEILDILKKVAAEDGLELTGFEFQSRDRDQRFLKVNFDAVSSEIYKQYGNDLLVRNIPVSMPKFENPASRKLPVCLGYPIYKCDTIVYEIPQGYNVENLPQSMNESVRFGKYSIDFRESKNEITVIKSMLLYRGNYPVEMYNDFYNYIENIRESENNAHILLTKK